MDPRKRHQLLVAVVILTVSAGCLLVLGAVLHSLVVLGIAIALAIVARTLAWQWTRAGHPKPPEGPGAPGETHLLNDAIHGWPHTFATM